MREWHGAYFQYRESLVLISRSIDYTGIENRASLLFKNSDREFIILSICAGYLDSMCDVPPTDVQAVHCTILVVSTTFSDEAKLLMLIFKQTCDRQDISKKYVQHRIHQIVEHIPPPTSSRILTDQRRTITPIVPTVHKNSISARRGKPKTHTRIIVPRDRRPPTNRIANIALPIRNLRCILHVVGRAGGDPVVQGSGRQLDGVEIDPDAGERFGADFLEGL
jgi:hypothetical protein